MELFDDIEKEIQSFFTDLNWTYILVYLSVLYGIKYKKEFDWYNDLMNKNKNLAKFKVWIAGIIIAIVFCIFRHTDGVAPMNSLYVSAILRSWVIAVVFNSVANSKIKKVDTDEKS